MTTTSFNSPLSRTTQGTQYQRKHLLTHSVSLWVLICLISFISYGPKNPLFSYWVQFLCWHLSSISLVYLQLLQATFTHNTHTNNHFTALIPGLPGWAGARRNHLLDSMVEGEISEADTLTIRLGATPSGLISNPPPSSPIFYTGCPSSHNAADLSWLGTCNKYAGLHTQWLISHV